MLLPEIAEGFQMAGITALIYDPRSTGASDGLPRNEIDPLKQVEDYSDALTFMAKQPSVDPSRIAFWGMSFSASVAACAAALDKRAKLLILVCPTVTFFTEQKLPKALGKAIQDRASQLKGNPAYSVVPFTPTGENPGGMASGGGRQAYEFMVDIKSRGAPNFENRTTMQTYYKMALWQPRPLLKLVAPTPVMVLIPEDDIISSTEDQHWMYDNFDGPKRLHTAPGKGHLNVLSGGDAEVYMQQQVDFIRDVYEGRVAR